MKKAGVFLTVMILLLSVRIFAETEAEKGVLIAQEAYARNKGFKDFTANLRMILKNKHGLESIRAMRIKTLEVKDDGNKSLMIFDNPKDVKGTVFLNFTHKFGDDDQWIYLPALKRVKRISSRNKTGSFMGSEFSYEDITGQEVEKYTYAFIRDEEYDGKECFVVASYPVDKKNSGYTKLINWIDKKEYRTWKIEFYDRKKSLLKTLITKSYQKYLNTFWRADEITMVNHQNGKSTRLEFSEYQFRIGLKDRDFSKNSLPRVR